MAFDHLSRADKVRKKIERAKYHVRDLERHFLEFRKENCHRFRTEIDPDTGDEVHRAVVVSTPPEFTLIIGDAVHNLRSALDHLAWQAHEFDGGIPDKYTFFPVCDAPTEYKPVDLAKKQKFSPRLIRLFESVQPYHSGYESLGLIHKLNNIDKHRFLFVTAFAVNGIMPTVRRVDEGPKGIRMNISGVASGAPIMNFSQFNADLVQGFRVNGPIGLQSDGALTLLEDGTEVGRMLAPVLAKDHAYLDLSFDVAFGEPSVVKGKPVIPFLTQCAQFVDGIVETFVSNRFLS